MLGPIDYSLNYSCGLLVEGFDTPPRVMMNHNPPCYSRLLESCGLTKAKDLYAWWFDRENPVIERWRPRVERAVARSGVVVRPLRRDDMPAEILRCRAIYNEAWKENWGDVPMTLDEFEHLAKFLSHLAVPDLLLIAEVNGRAVAFSLTLPDFNEAAQPQRPVVLVRPADRACPILAEPQASQDSPAVGSGRDSRVPPPGNRRAADPADVRIRRASDGLHRRGTELDT